MKDKNYVFSKFELYFAQIGTIKINPKNKTITNQAPMKNYQASSSVKKRMKIFFSVQN